MYRPSALIDSLRRILSNPNYSNPTRRWTAAWVERAGRLYRNSGQLLRRRWYWAAMVLLLLALDFWLITNNALFRGAPAVQPVVVETAGQAQLPTSLPVIPGGGQETSQSAQAVPPPNKVTATLTRDQADSSVAEEVMRPAEAIPEPISLSLPLRGETLRLFGFDLNSLYQDYRLHAGVDWGASGGTPVTAAMDGQVTQVENSDLFHYRVTVDHGAGWQTLYAHLDKVRVKKGQKVRTGEPLAQVGSPGLEEPDATHLHFELRRQGQAIDPLPYLVQ